ncbi:MAG: hypothetical protein AAGC60_04505 [Acidobacteriota bacterium]
MARALLPSVAWAAVLLTMAVPTAARPIDVDRWLVVESSSLTLLSDAEPEVAAATLERLEQFRAVFAQLAPALELRSPAPTQFYAFRDLEAYAPYVAGREGRGSHILGQFVMRPWGNTLTLTAGARAVGASAWAVVLHEYTHYLVTHNLPGAPLWLNEGLAEYYSSFEVDDGRAIVGQPLERHLDFLARDGAFDLAELLTTDQRTASAHDGGEVGRFYGLSWLLVHYLLSGDAERLDRTADYLARLLEGDDAEGAFEDAFGRSLASMEDELRDYLAAGDFAAASYRLDRLRVSPARVRRAPPELTWTRLGELEAQLGDLDAAADHAHRALGWRPDDADARALRAHVLDLQGRFDEADILWREALPGLERAKLHLWHGLHALSVVGGEGHAAASDAARRSLQAAVDRRSDYGQALVLLARAEMRPGGDAGRAVDAAARARALLPERFDVLVLGVEAHLHDALDGVVLGPPREADAETVADEQSALDRESAAVARADALLERQLVVRAVTVGELEVVARLRAAVERTRLLVEAQEAFVAGAYDDGLELLDLAVSAARSDAVRAALEAELLRLTDELAG